MADSVVTLVGTMTRDPDMRFTQGGRAVANGGIAVNRRYQQNNEWVEQTSFFNLVVWGTLAENFAASCSKGTRVVLTGRLEQRSYETQAGEKRNVVEIVVEDLGPSLKWATAAVEKTSRNDSNSGGQQRSSQQSSGGSGYSAEYDYPEGEEPF